MIRLVDPNEKYIKSYIDAFNEYKSHGITSYGLSDATETDVLEKFDNYRNERNLKPGRVGSHFFWLVDEERDYFIGEVSIRHKLTDALEKCGGHIGYGIRVSEWNKGYGTLILKLALTEAKNIGLSEVLITCNDNNIGSARVMEKNGFALCDKIENIIEGKSIITRRYRKVL